MTEPVRKTEAATVDRIIAVAESMFADAGYRGVSLRAVMRECGVNAASVHYHFGSKEALLEEIFARRAGALNTARLQLLDRCLAAGADADDALERILHAFLYPAFALPDGDAGVRRFTRLRAVIAHENATLSQRLIALHFNDTSNRFLAALRRVLPELSRNALFWRFHFLLGAQYYTLSNPGRVESLSAGSFDSTDLQRALDEMIAFVAAGFRAPVPRRTRSGGALRTETAPRDDIATAQIDDALWRALAAQLPPAPPNPAPRAGRKPISDREALSGIVYVLRAQLPWRELPAAQGFRAGVSCWRRLREWQADGTWPRLAAVLRRRLPDSATLDFKRLETPTE